MKREMICIVCPRGCHLTIDENLTVTGHQCPRGKVYAENEIKAPKRVLTTTVKTIFEDFPRLSCKSQEAIPKEKLFEAMKEINEFTLTRYVNMGDVLIKNIAQTGVDVIATKTYKGELK